MEACYAIAPKANLLAVLGDTTSAPSAESELPPNATVVNLYRDWSHLTMDEKCAVTFELIKAKARRATIHARLSLFAEAFLAVYRGSLSDNPVIAYVFFLPRPWGSGLERADTHWVDNNIGSAKYLITENMAVINDYTAIRGQATPDPKWRCLRVPHALSGSAMKIRELRQRRGDGARLSRALWASRIDAQKRPGLVGKIARLLRSRGARCEIDMYGSAAPAGDLTLDQLTRDVNYKGEFTRFGDLPTAEYACFVYTSWEDGIPNVLPEAASYGIPIIAPDVGGISEFIVDRVTGLLLPSTDDDDKMAARYAAAIESLVDDASLGSQLAIAAALRVETMFSPAAHLDAVRSLLFPPSQDSGGESVMSVSDTRPTAEMASSSRAETCEIETARLRANIERLEIRNEDLRRALQAAREHSAGRTDDARVRLAGDEICLDERKLPVKLFRSLSKAWAQSGKRLLLRVALRMVGVKA